MISHRKCFAEGVVFWGSLPWLVIFGISLVVHAAANATAPSVTELSLEPIVTGTPGRIEGAPEAVVLGSRRQVQQVIVTAHYPDGLLQDVTRVATMVSENEEVVRVTDGVFKPTGDGATVVRVQVGQLQQAIPVTVRVDSKGLN